MKVKICLLGTLLMSLVAAAESGIAYSGRLMVSENGTKKVPENLDAAVTFYVRLYDDSDGAVTDKSKARWGRAVSARVQDGWFSLELGDDIGDVIGDYPDKSLADVFSHVAGDGLAIGITPFDDSRAEIDPHQRFASVPYAAVAEDALGSGRGLSVTGRLVAQTLSVEKDAVFDGKVVHQGMATFVRSPKLEDLKFVTDEQDLVVKTLEVRSADTAVGSLSVGRVETDRVESDKVRSLSRLSADSLSVRGALTAERMSGSGAVEFSGAATLTRVETKDVCVGSAFEFFKWKNSVITLPPRPDGPARSAYGYKGDGSSGEWIATCDCFVTLSPASSGTVTVTVGDDDSGLSFALSYNGGQATLPFQTFLREGERISWTGAEKEPDQQNGGLMRYREFTY